MTELHVYMGSSRVGVLDGSDPRGLSFAYDRPWIEDPRATPISLSLPKRLGSYRHAELAPYLWGLLPDNERVLQRWARDYQCSATNVFALLENVGTDVAGAAQYVHPGVDPEESETPTLEPVSDQMIADLLREVRKDATAWHSGSRQHWSLAGAQAKIALAYDPNEDIWSIPRGSAPTTHILKPAIEGLVNHDLNEHLCLATARELGLRSATSRINTFGDERALVVERYDRQMMSDGRIIRIHQEDLCQALGVHPERKYESDGGPGIGDMTSIVRQNANDPAEVERLCTAVAYNWLVLGTDAHAKNYSLLLSGQQVRLAPLYDIASAAPSALYAPKAKLAQKIGGEYRASWVKRRHLERMAEVANLDAYDFIARIVDLAADLPDAMTRAIEFSDLTESEREVAESMHKIIGRWVASCATTLTKP